MPLQKLKRGSHFGVLTGMWIFQIVTLHRVPTLESHRPKLGLRSTSSNAILVEMIPLINPLLSSNPGNDKIKQQPVTSKMCSSFPGWVLSFDL